MSSSYVLFEEILNISKVEIKLNKRQLCRRKKIRFTYLSVSKSQLLKDTPTAHS